MKTMELDSGEIMSSWKNGLLFYVYLLAGLALGMNLFLPAHFRFGQGLIGLYVLLMLPLVGMGLKELLFGHPKNAGERFYNWMLGGGFVLILAMACGLLLFSA